MSVDVELEAVDTATLRLIRAAATGQPEAIDSAVADREAALDMLQRALQDHGIDACEKRRVVEAVALRADEALTALGLLRDSSGAALRRLARGARVLRGYATRSAEPSALDREG